MLINQTVNGYKDNSLNITDREFYFYVMSNVDWCVKKSTDQSGVYVLPMFSFDANVIVGLSEKKPALLYGMKQLDFLV